MSALLHEHSLKTKLRELALAGRTAHEAATLLNQPLEAIDTIYTDPQFRADLWWLTEQAPCTCQLSSGWLGHGAAANYQPRVPF
jgi:hypothetical protein